MVLIAHMRLPGATRLVTVGDPPVANAVEVSLSCFCVLLTPAHDVSISLLRRHTMSRLSADLAGPG
jgi:hypothetical protein